MNDDLHSATSVGSAPPDVKPAVNPAVPVTPGPKTGEPQETPPPKPAVGPAVEPAVQQLVYAATNAKKELGTSLRSIVDRLKDRNLGGGAKRAALQVAGLFKTYADNISALMQELRSRDSDNGELLFSVSDSLKVLASIDPKVNDTDPNIVKACYAVVNLIPAADNSLPVLASADLWRAVTDLPHILACVYVRFATDLTKDAYIHLVRRLTALGAAVGSPLYEAMMQDSNLKTSQRESSSEDMILSSLRISHVRACAFSSVSLIPTALAVSPLGLLDSQSADQHVPNILGSLIKECDTRLQKTGYALKADLLGRRIACLQLLVRGENNDSLAYLSKRMLNETAILFGFQSDPEGKNAWQLAISAACTYATLVWKTIRSSETSSAASGTLEISIVEDILEWLTNPETAKTAKTAETAEAADTWRGSCITTEHAVFTIDYWPGVPANTGVSPDNNAARWGIMAVANEFLQREYTTSGQAPTLSTGKEGPQRMARIGWLLALCKPTHGSMRLLVDQTTYLAEMWPTFSEASDGDSAISHLSKRGNTFGVRHGHLPTDIFAKAINGEHGFRQLSGLPPEGDIQFLQGPLLTGAARYRSELETFAVQVTDAVCSNLMALMGVNTADKADDGDLYFDVPLLEKATPLHEFVKTISSSIAYLREILTALLKFTTELESRTLRTDLERLIRALCDMQKADTHFDAELRFSRLVQPILYAMRQRRTFSASCAHALFWPLLVGGRLDLSYADSSWLSQVWKKEQERWVKAYKVIVGEGRSLSAYSPFALPIPMQFDTGNTESRDSIAEAGCEAFHCPCAELRTLLERARSESFIAKGNSVVVGLIGVAPESSTLTILSAMIWQSDAVSNAAPELSKGVLLSRDEYMGVHESGGCVLAAMLSQLVRGWEDSAHIERFKSIRIHVDVTNTMANEQLPRSSEKQMHPLERHMLRQVAEHIKSTKSAPSSTENEPKADVDKIKDDLAQIQRVADDLTDATTTGDSMIDKSVKYSNAVAETSVASTLQLGSWWSLDPKSALMRRIYQDRVVFEALGYAVDPGPGSRVSVEFTRRALQRAEQSGTAGTALNVLETTIAPGGGPPLRCYCASVADAVGLDLTSEQLKSSATTNSRRAESTVEDQFRAEFGGESATKYFRLGGELQEMYATRITAEEQRRKV